MFDPVRRQGESRAYHIPWAARTVVGMLLLAAVCTALPRQSSAAPQAPLGGIVVDKQKTPIAGARVVAVQNLDIYRTREELAPLASGVTGADGRFSIQLPGRDSVCLLVSAKGFRLMRFTVNLAADSRRMVGIMLEPGEEVSGRVVDAQTSAPVAGALLGLIRPLGGGEQEKRFIPQWAESGADGTFEFAGVTPGSQLLYRVRAAGYEQSGGIVRPGSGPATVALKKGGHRIAGSLNTRSGGGPALAGTPVRVKGNLLDTPHLAEAMEDETKADAQGNFAFEGLPAGKYVVEPVIDPAIPRTTANITLPAENAAPVVLEISAGYFVSGMTLDMETSAPVEGVPLHVHDRETSSGPGGLFVVGPFYALGQLNISVPTNNRFYMGEGFQPPYTNGFDDLEDVNIGVRMKLQLNVRIDNVRDTTSPASLYMLRPQTAMMHVPVRGELFALPLPPPAQYLAYAGNAAMASALTLIEVQPAKEANLDLHLEAAAAVTGSVEAGAGFEIRLTPADPMTSSVTVAETAAAQDGSYRLEGLPAGDFIVHIAPRGSSAPARQIPVKLTPGRTETLQPVRAGGQ